jgi:hypothetical protein
MLFRRTFPLGFAAPATRLIALCLDDTLPLFGLLKGYLALT